MIHQHCKHLYSWETITQTTCKPSKIQWRNLTLEHTFEITEHVKFEQSGEIYGATQISWEDSSWKQKPLANDEEVTSRPHNLGSCFLFLTLELVREIQKIMTKMSEPEQFQGRIIFMLMFNDIMWRSTENERECIANVTRLKYKKFRIWVRNWVWFNLQKTSRKIGSSRWIEDDQSHRNRTPHFPKPRVHCFEERSRAKEMENYQYTSPTKKRLQLFSRTSLSIDSVSTEESQTCLKSRTIWSKWRQHPRFKFLHNKIYCRNKERVEKLLPQPNQLTKIEIDTRFLKVVEVGWYFMTRHTDESLQFAETMTCREYTLLQVDKETDPKGWIQGNKAGLHWKSNQFLSKWRRVKKEGVEIRIESVNKDNSHSWVRISHGLKLVTDLIDKEYANNKQETSTTKTDVSSFARRRSKVKANPRRPSATCSDRSSVPRNKKKNEHSSWTRTVISKRRWCDRIQETKWWSSKKIWVFSILIWRCMAEQDDMIRRRQ